MPNFKNISDISLDQLEYAITVGAQHYASSSFDLYIPKLMSDTLSPRTEPFNRNILVNASSCKPTVGTSIRTKDSISVKRSANCSLAHKCPDIEEHPYVPGGTLVTCSCANGNYRNLTIIDS